MNKILGITSFIIGGILVIYTGFWVMFVGGIMDIATMIDLHNITATGIAWNLIKIFLASPVGIIIFLVFSWTGAILLSD